MNKEFYIVVPYYLDVTSKKKDNAGFKLANLFKTNTDTMQTTEMFEQRKRDLIQRTNLVAQGLAQLGIRAAVLSTQEITELFYTAYNQEEATNQNLVDIEQMTTPVVERGDADPEPYLGPEQQEQEPADLYSAAQAQQAPQPQQPMDPGLAPQQQTQNPPQNPLIGGGV
jgi:hypothetical protein